MADYAADILVEFQGSGPQWRYLMRGWRPGTADYETWVAIGAPNSSNPSGQPITDITIQASWSS